MEDYYETIFEQDNDDQDNYTPEYLELHPEYLELHRDESLQQSGEPADDDEASSSKVAPRTGKGMGSKGKSYTGKGKKRSFDHDYAKTEIVKRQRIASIEYKNAKMSGLQGSLELHKNARMSRSLSCPPDLD